MEICLGGHWTHRVQAICLGAGGPVSRLALRISSSAWQVLVARIDVGVSAGADNSQLAPGTVSGRTPTTIDISISQALQRRVHQLDTA